jgi:hypothetical protein
MRPNPFDLDRAIEDARTDRPRPGAEERAVASLRAGRPTRRSRPLPRFVMIATASLALLVFPLVTTKSPSAAWALVASATAGQRRFHETVHYVLKGGGTTVAERWTDGRRSVWFLGGKRKRGYFGTDGVRSYRYFPGNDYAIVTNVGGRRSEGAFEALGVDSLDVEEITRAKDVRQIGDPVRQTTPEGPRLRYRLKRSGRNAYYEEVRVYTALDDPRVRRWEAVNAAGDTEIYGLIDYPEQVPQEVFEGIPPKGVKVFDIDRETARLRKTVAKGLGTQTVNGHSITLRAVMVDPRNNVSVLWTGTPPNGDLQPPVQIDGTKTRLAYGLSILTNKVYEYVPPAVVPDFLPGHLAGMSIQTTKPVPDRIDLTVPVFAPDRSRPVYDFEGRRTGYRSRFVGQAKFRNVPVLRPGPFFFYLDVLGLREPRPYEALVREYRQKPAPKLKARSSKGPL